MMKKYLTLLFFAIAATTVSQNMVNNPSFENYTICPSTQGQFNATNWQVAANNGYSSPDYFNMCVPITNNEVAIPNNVCGSQSPYEGNAYSGIFCYGGNSVQREYIQTQLTSPMVAGQIYHISFRVSFGDKFGTAIGSLGAHISNNPITGSGVSGLINATPQIVSNGIISDQMSWTEIAGDYTASGGERYLTIGNYLTDELTPKSVLNPNPIFWFWGYYYIDMVSVTTNSLHTNEFDNIPITVSPNPFNEKLYLHFDDFFSWKNMFIYSANGKLVMESSEVLSVVNLNHLISGVYYLVIITQDNTKHVKKIVKL